MENTYEDFIAEIKKLTGIDLSFYKERQMKRRIRSLFAKCGYDSYVESIEALKRDDSLYKQFMKHMTINVSEFFRNYPQWEVLEKEVIPYLMDKFDNLNIWSAACASGEEPYSLVMLLSKFLPLSSINILATDIDDEVLNKARIGLFNEKSLEGIPDYYIKKFFTKEGEVYKVNDEIKQRVEFRKHDLLNDEYPKDNNLVVCRNVMIYFTEVAKEQIYVKFNRALKNNGVLFVGSTEQIIMCDKYNFTPMKTFFYKKIDNI